MMVFSISVCLYFLFSGNWHVSNLTAGSENGTMFAEGAGGFAMAMAVLSLKFIGFELTPTLIEETNISHAKKMWVVILTALIIHVQNLATGHQILDLLHVPDADYTLVIGVVLLSAHLSAS